MSLRIVITNRRLTAARLVINRVNRYVGNMLVDVCIVTRWGLRRRAFCGSAVRGNGHPQRRTLQKQSRP